MRKISAFLLWVVLLSGCASDDQINNPNLDPDNSEDEDDLSLCEDIYPCNNYHLIAHLSLADFEADSGNDSWGWTDPETHKEYAIMGVDNGTVFVDISTPEAPIYLGKLPTATTSSLWRDVKVYDNYAYIVSEAEAHGMQVFDLSRLRNVAMPPEIFTVDATYNAFGDAHNIVINEASGYACAVGTQTYNGGPHFVDISDPLNPLPAGGYEDAGYSHDAQIVTYNGPDIEHIGKEIYIGSNEDQIVLLDITDTENPIPLASITYPNVGYTHQGWLTEDHTYFFLGDERDELDTGVNSRTLVFDFSDLDDPIYYRSYTGPTTAIDHNGYVKGSLFYLANYTAGVRIIDISTIDNMNEIGFFDTHPDNDNPSFNGTWNIYPFFESGHLVVSDLDFGLFIIKENKPVEKAK